MDPAPKPWKMLYRVGGIAPLVAVLFYLSEFAVGLAGIPFPTTGEGWFALFARNKLLGLWMLNALDVLSIAFLGVMFLALYVALKRDYPSAATIGLFFALLGIVVFVSTRAMMVSATLALSDRYAAATTELQRVQIALSLETMHAPARATPETTGFFFMAVGGAVLSATMLRFGILGRAAGYVGIVGGLATLLNDVCIVVAPQVAAILMPINGLLWLVWWLLVSRGLLRHATDRHLRRIVREGSAV